MFNLGSVLSQISKDIIDVLPRLFFFTCILCSNSYGQQVNKKIYITERNPGITAKNSLKVEILPRESKGSVFNNPSGYDNVLWFKSSGQLISFPPEMLKTAERVAAKISLDENFWGNRVTKVLNDWITIVEALRRYVPASATYSFGSDNYKDVQEEMVYKLEEYVKNTTYIPPTQKAYYLNKIRLLGITGRQPDGVNDFTPSLESLIDPQFEIEYFFYDSEGRRINDKGDPYCKGEETIRKFELCEPCEKGDKKEAKKNNAGSPGSYQSDAITVPPGCFEVKYQLRIKNNNVQVMMQWSANPDVKFPTPYPNQIVKTIEDKFGEPFMKRMHEINLQLEKLKKNPLDQTIDLNAIERFISAGIIDANAVIGLLNSSAANNPYRDWVAHWLWLTGGVPQMNPFGSAQAIFQNAKVEGKVTKEEKALNDIFDNMVAKGAFKIEDLVQIDSNFKNIPRIKAAIAAEAAQQTNEPMLQDRLLYEGLLKTSPGGNIYMRHLDAMTSYVIMVGKKPRMEITEEDKMYILTENKKTAVKLSIDFQTTPIASENTRLTDELLQSAADKALVGPKRIGQNQTQRQRENDVDATMKLFNELLIKVNALRTLPRINSLPLYFEKDISPDLVTDILEHDYLYDAPATATYTVKEVIDDKTEKELRKGGYRINKLYHFRLKAGVIYSFLRKRDFTEVSPGNFTLDDPQSGIDGTFGVQYYFHKQDIRSSQIKWRSFLYVSLSMKKITENFYAGLGLEPYSGFAIVCNAHVGKREALSGNNIPTGIKSTWGVHLGTGILVDLSLFNRVLSFGNTNKSLIGF